MVRSALSISRWLFIISLFLPAVAFYRTAGFGKGLMYGIEIFLEGWLAPFVSIQYAWFANLFLFRSWHHAANGRWRKAKLLSAIAILISLNTFTWIQFPLPGDEGGVSLVFLIYPHTGFFAWFASMSVIFVCSYRIDIQTD